LTSAQTSTSYRVTSK